MAGLCSSTVTSGTCGSSRGFTECVALNSCDGDISSRLQNHHPSRENVCEKDLILARAGLLELTEEQVKNINGLSSLSLYPGKVLAGPKDLPVSKTSWQENCGDWNPCN